MKRVLTLILGAVSLAAGAQDLGFKGVPLGAPKDELLGKFPSLECKAPGRLFALLGEEHCTPRLSYKVTEETRQFFSYGGQPATDLAFGLVGGRLGKFSMIFDPDRYQAIKNSLQEAYGQGRETMESRQTNAGVRFNSRTFKVQRAEGALTLMEHAGRIDQGAIVGTSNEFEAYERRVMSGDAKSGSKDL